MLAINPDECIDCALCVPECPVDAIYADDDLPQDQTEFLELNATLANEWPNISEQKPPLPDADDWKDKPDKRQWLEKEW